jgi:hypothetical protein
MRFLILEHPVVLPQAGADELAAENVGMMPVPSEPDSENQ